jgi:hypothetical protein
MAPVFSVSFVSPARLNQEVPLGETCHWIVLLPAPVSTICDVPPEQMEIGFPVAVGAETFGPIEICTVSSAEVMVKHPPDVVTV